MKRKVSVSKILLAVILAVVTVAVLYPLVFTLSASFADPYEFSANPFQFDITNPENYEYAWDELKDRVWTSTVVAAISVVGHVLITCMVSYAIGVLKFKGSKLFSFFMLTGLFLTSEITSIPTAPAIAEASYQLDGQRRTRLPLDDTPYERRGR